MGGGYLKGGVVECGGKKNGQKRLKVELKGKTDSYWRKALETAEKLNTSPLCIKNSMEYGARV